MLRFTAAGPRDSLYKLYKMCYDLLRDAGPGRGGSWGVLMRCDGAGLGRSGPACARGVFGCARVAMRRWAPACGGVHGGCARAAAALSHRVGLECSPASAWQLSQGARRTPLAGVGLPKQLGHARPRARMLAEARFPRRYHGCPTCVGRGRRPSSARGGGAAARRCCRHRPRRRCPFELRREHIGSRWKLFAR